eukprot:299753_1
MARTLRMLMSFCIFHSAIVTAKLNQVQCGSNITSQMSSAITHDYELNLSTLSSRYKHLDVEFITFPPIPIDIYFANTTMYKSCTKQCYISQITTDQNYIIRLSKYLGDIQIINYTFSIICNKPYITTIYEPCINTSIIWIHQYVISPYDEFRNPANILSFGVSILIVLVFIFTALFIHRASHRPEIRFLSRKSNWAYYLCSIITLLICIILCNHPNYYVLGLLIAFTMTSSNLISVIGMKFYRSLRYIKIMNTNWTFAKLCQLSTLVLLIVYLVLYYSCFTIGISLNVTVLIITYIQLAILSAASMVSKTAQIQWFILFISIIQWYHSVALAEDIFFHFYWYCMFCIAGALASLFLVSHKSHAK